MKVSEFYAPNPRKLGMGSRLVNTFLGEKYVLAHSGSGHIHAVNIRTGNYYRTPVWVQDVAKLTQSEAEDILGNLNDWFICNE